MLRPSFVYASLAGLSLATLAGLSAVGCSSSSEDADSSNGASSAEPPAKPSNGGAGDGDGQTFAVKRLFLGDTDWEGNAKDDAWQIYGYNLDNKITSETSTDVCKPRAGSLPKVVKKDGPGGLDNTFGKILLPILTGLAPDASSLVNENIASGSFTILMKIDTLGAQANYIDLPAALYVGRNLGGPAKFDGTDAWPVVPELLSDPMDPNSSKVKFPTSYLANNTWVSGSEASVDIKLSVAGYELNLGITNAIITMDIGAGRNTATHGIIAGVLPVEPLIAELKKVAGGFNPELCSGSTFESIAESIRQAADSLEDGTQSASKECSAISIGLGFEAVSATIAGVADPAVPADDPCAEPMGSGGAGGGN